MSLRRSLLILLALSGGGAAEADSPYERTMDLSLNQVARIQVHLAQVEADLRDHPPAGLSEDQARAREACLDHLSGYWQAGCFPENSVKPGYTPVFIDRHGTHCAVGELMRRTGAEDVARDIAAHTNLAYLPELAARPDVVAWANQNGLTLEECARIQPSYCFGGAPTDVEVTSVGNDLHITWVNQDSYDYIWIDLEWGSPLGLPYVEVAGDATSTIVEDVDWGLYNIALGGDCGGFFPDPWSVPVEFIHAPPMYRRGDANGDGQIDIADGVRVLDWMFSGANPVDCEASTDTNVDATIDISDPIYLFNYLLLGGPPPAAPFPECAVDEAAELSCVNSGACP